MNKALIATAFIIALGLASLASAQIPGYPNGCARCGTYAFVDSPATPDAKVPVATAGDWIVAGWGFECESGQPVTRVELWYSGDDGFYKPVPYWLTGLYAGVYRPDVANAFRGACPKVTQYTGYGLQVLAGAVPVGTRALIVNAWRGPYMTQTRRIIVVR